ncbi:unnamed protein product [Closterium sp. Yama58-4]|nr:unnamed protein product [Closterium sp. Yama58-4]
MTSLELECRYAYTDPLPPPVHTFPTLRSLSILFVPTHYRFISLCSSLTSLTLLRPYPFALVTLASRSSPLRHSLAALTIHNAKLGAVLKPLTAFPRLTSLAFHSCSIDPCDLHTFSRSLHTLTHLAIHDCLMIPSQSLAALAESNPALASLSLHSTSHFLFIPQGLRDLFLSSSSRLHTLTLSGLPSCRQGMLARCSSLQRLTLKGRGAERESILLSESPQKPSLDCIVAMLVHVEQWGMLDGAQGRDDGVERWEGAMAVDNQGEGSTAASPAAASEEEAGDESDAMTTTEAEAAENGEPALPAAAATTVVACGGMTRGSSRRRYVDLRREAAAERAEFVAAMDNWMAFTKMSKWKLKEAAREAVQHRHMHQGLEALHYIHQAAVHVRSAILHCRCVRLAKAKMRRRGARDGAVAKACRAADAAGFFTAAAEDEEVEVEPEREEEGRGGEGIEAEEVVRYMPEDDLEDDLAAVSEKLLAWVAVPQADAQELLHALMESLTLDTIRFVSTCDRSGLPSLPSACSLMCPSPPTTPFPSLPSSSSPSSIPRLISEPQSFESLARAAALRRLKSLAILNCCGLEEGQLVTLLRACGMLEDLRVEGCSGFSDTVIAGSKLEALTRLSVVGCSEITADAIGRLLGNMPRLRYLKVEVNKVSQRARRELLRAGVLVRGV